MPATTTKVAVLYGGQSPEHDVSVTSASRIVADMDRTLFTPVPIKITKDGQWHLPDLSLSPDLSLNKLSSNLAPVTFTSADLTSNVVKPQILTGWQNCFAVAFPIIHGPGGEDGSLQGLLELAGIPYVGSGILASALGMDKDYARRLVTQQGMNSVPYLVISNHQWQHDASLVVANIQASFRPSWFVKPANLGSSIGITKVVTPTQLPSAIELAFTYTNKVLVEPAITPLIELEVCVLESLSGPTPIVSMVGQVEHHDEYYTYAAKYAPGGAEILIPAPLDPQLAQQVQHLAGNIFTTLGAAGMARVDFFLNPDTGAIYFNEINTAPGCTDSSAYPKIMNASGWSMTAIITTLVQLALAKNTPKQ